MRYSLSKNYDWLDKSEMKDKTNIGQSFLNNVINNICQLHQIVIPLAKTDIQTFCGLSFINNDDYLCKLTCESMYALLDGGSFVLQTGKYSKPIKLKNGYSIIQILEKASLSVFTKTEYLINKSYPASDLNFRMIFSTN